MIDFYVREVVLVEKTDRLSRNRTDALRVEQLEQERDVEIHLVKESTVIGKDSRSQVRFTHGRSRRGREILIR